MFLRIMAHTLKVHNIPEVILDSTTGRTCHISQNVLEHLLCYSLKIPNVMFSYSIKHNAKHNCDKWCSKCLPTFLAHWGCILVN